MSSLLLIIEREYLTRVKKKSFIILTLLMPFLIVLLSLVPLWLATLNDGTEKHIGVIDSTGIYEELFGSSGNYIFQPIDKSDQADSENRVGKDLFAILRISEDLSRDGRAVSLTSEKQAPLELQSYIQRILKDKVTEQRLDQLTASGSVESEAIAEVRNIIEDTPAISLKTMRIGGDGSVTESSTEVATIIGMLFTFLIYMFILLYGNMVMQGVLEEKKSRVVEVMVSSVEPVNLLIGKIVGIGLVGLTQLALWVGMTVVLFSGVSLFIGSPEQAAALSGDMSNFPVDKIISSVMGINWFEIIIYFVLFFVGGYVLYASIFAMFASAVDSEEDTTQFMTPLTLLIVFAFMAGFYSVTNPDGPLAFWTSLIPFTSPIVMMVRVPFGIPFWQILLSLLILWGTFILISIVAAKVYRVGILMYGKKPSLKEIYKWISYR